MTLAIADDDALIVDSLRMLLSLEEGIDVLWTAKDGREATTLAAKHPPDILLMDIRMPICDGVEATRRIKEQNPQIRVVLLTTFTDDEYIRSALAAGAEGYLLKSTPADALIARLRVVDSGARVYDDALSQRISGADPQPRHLDALTERENEVLYLIAQGHSNREIAALLYLSEGTVRNAVSAILDKLGLRDRVQLAVYYWKNA